MKYTVLIHTHPYQTESLAAYRACQAVLASGHTIQLVFFDRDGVYHANSFSVTPQDELDLRQAWLNLAKQYHFPLHVCSAAATHRGVITPEQSQFYEKQGSNWQEGYIPSGLGQLFSAIEVSDQLMEF
jgi:tRNA 2-thiouridine synthesizing protein D